MNQITYQEKKEILTFFIPSIKEIVVQKNLKRKKIFENPEMERGLITLENLENYASGKVPVRTLRLGQSKKNVFC